MRDFFKLRAFNQWLFDGVDQINWFDHTGLINLDEKFVTLNLDCTARNYYDGYLVEVYNKKQGLIFKKKFFFKDYINVEDVTGDHRLKMFYESIQQDILHWGPLAEKAIIEHKKFDFWGDNVETKKYTDAILRFLEIILYEK